MTSGGEAGEGTGTADNRLPGRILRFGLVGGIGFLVDAGVLAAVVAAGLPPVPARVVSIAVALLVTWRLNRGLTFRTAAAPSVGEFLSYAGVGAGSSLVNFAVYTALLAGGWVVSPLLALAAGSAVAMSLTFLGLDRLVFRHARPAVRSDT